MRSTEQKAPHYPVSSSVLHSPVTSLLLIPSILLSTLFSKTLSLRSCFIVRGQVSQSNRFNYGSVCFDLHIFLGVYVRIHVHNTFDQNLKRKQGSPKGGSATSHLQNSPGPKNSRSTSTLPYVSRLHNFGTRVSINLSTKVERTTATTISITISAKDTRVLTTHLTVALTIVR